METPEPVEKLSEIKQQPHERKKHASTVPRVKPANELQGVPLPVHPEEITNEELLNNPNKALTSGKIRQRTTQVLLDAIYLTNDPALKNELEAHLQESKGDKTFKEKPAKEDPIFSRKKKAEKFLKNWHSKQPDLFSKSEKIKSVLTRDPMIARKKFFNK